MLVLSRKLEEQIRIGDDITISILRVKGNTVRVGIEAPRSVRVVRGELPLHGPGSAPSGRSATPEGEGSENGQDEEEAMSVDVEISDTGATALRQFLANRARRSNRAPHSRRAADRALAASMTRSA